MSDWQTIGGATREMFLVGKEWAGPGSVEAILSDDDDIKAMRGMFTKPDGSKVWAVRKNLRHSVKHSFQPVGDHHAR